jgi:hypothetical protein
MEVITTTTSQKQKTKTKKKLGNVCCHSVLNFLSSCPLPRNVTIKTFRKKIILSVILSGCEY